MQELNPSVKQHLSLKKYILDRLKVFIIFINMDLNKIFNNFEDDDSQNIHAKRIVEEWRYSPSYKIGMFKKIVSNYSFIKDLFVKNISNSELEIDEKDVKEAGEFITYSRAWNYIKNCILQDNEWQNALIYSYDDYLLCSLKLSLNYFESQEEYEKCILFREILSFLNLSLASQK